MKGNQRCTRGLGDGRGIETLRKSTEPGCLMSRWTLSGSITSNTSYIMPLGAMKGIGELGSCLCCNSSKSPLRTHVRQTPLWEFDPAMGNPSVSCSDKLYFSCITLWCCPGELFEALGEAHGSKVLGRLLATTMPFLTVLGERPPEWHNLH